MPSSHYPSTRRLAAVALSAAICFAIAAELASLRTLNNFEVQIFRFVYGWGEVWRPLFLAITQTGSAWMLAIVPLMAYQARQKTAARRLLVIGVVALVSMEVLKYFIARPRPARLLDGFMQREAFITGMGFPSGHTTIATALAVGLVFYLPRRYRWFLLVWPLAVGVSRVYLGVHAPLDVVGGWCLGVLITTVLFLVWRRPRRSLVSILMVAGPRQKRRRDKATVRKITDESRPR